MKRKIWDKAKKYVYLLCLDIAVFLLFLLALLIISSIEKNGGMFNEVFSYADIIMIYIYPIYFLIRAILCRKHIMMGLISSAMTFFEMWLGWPIISLDFRFHLLFSTEWTALPAIVFVINLILTVIVFAIYKLALLIKSYFKKLDEQ